MLVNIINGQVNGTVTISNAQKEQEFLENNPTFIKTEFVFAEDVDLYEYDGTTFNLIEGWEQTKAEREAELANATINAQGVQVPNSITKRQAKQMLILGGYYTQVQPMIDAIVDDTERLLAQVFWDDSQTFERHHPQLIAFASLLGISDAALDQMFIDGAKLT